MPVQVRGEVLSLRRVGAYHQMTVVAPGIAEHTKPGQFVAVAVGGDETAMLLRRAFSIFDVSERGVFGGTVDFVFAVTGKGTAWLANRHAHDAVDVVGPLGRPFALPRDPARCLLVGGGYGTAPLFLLGKALAQRGCRIDFALGASTEDRLFGALDAKRMATSLAVTTDDGSAGEKGLVSDVLAEMIVRNRSEVVYACGPMGMLRAVGEIATEHEIPCQVAVEESMACGIGVCMTCVLPVIDDDGATRMLRSCIDGPVFRSDRIRWEDIGTVPADAVGGSGGEVA
ncbi:MAG: dihydroorotate dehydrogenase electron transfer subunit [Actinomycetes bacterium]